MDIFLRKLFLALLIVSPYTSIAQTACPVGVAAGDMRCGPAPEDEAVAQAPPSPTPAGWWEESYGAFVSDWDAEIVGAAQRRKTQHAAVEYATSQCEQNGGKRCTILATFKNICAAFSWPRKKEGNGQLSYGYSPEEAEQRSVNECVENNGGQCDLAYSGCSLPVFHFY